MQIINRQQKEIFQNLRDFLFVIIKKRIGCRMCNKIIEEEIEEIGDTLIHTHMFEKYKFHKSLIGCSRGCYHLFM